MPSVADHYSRHLGPVYSWMVGGVESALQHGTTEIESLSINPSGCRFAVDLGAGFGMHAIPLARLGFSVLAIDSCRELLDSLLAHRGDLPIHVIQDDMLAFRTHLDGRVEVVLCMGDTLTHLQDIASVQGLTSEVAAALEVGGTFVLTFRDYSSPLRAEQRFIPVKSDDQRILTCFLEYGDTHVTVHDMLHERTGSQWELRVSSYQKLRLAAQGVVDILKSSGFEVRREAGIRGMVRLVARRV